MFKIKKIILLTLLSIALLSGTVLAADTAWTRTSTDSNGIITVKAHVYVDDWFGYESAYKKLSMPTYKAYVKATLDVTESGAGNSYAKIYGSSTYKVRTTTGTYYWSGYLYNSSSHYIRVVGDKGSYGYQTATATAKIYPYYKFNVSSGTGGYVSKTLSGSKFKAGKQIGLTAKPKAGYEFAYWTGDASGSDPTITVTVNEDKNITAYFKRIRYLVNKSVTGEGSIYLDPAPKTQTRTYCTNYDFSWWSGYTCTSWKTEKLYDYYYHGETVTATAKPSGSPWVFTEWINSDISGKSSSKTFTVTGSLTDNYDSSSYLDLSTEFKTKIVVNEPVPPDYKSYPSLVTHPGSKPQPPEYPVYSLNKPRLEDYPFKELPSYPTVDGDASAYLDPNTKSFTAPDSPDYKGNVVIDDPTTNEMQSSVDDQKVQSFKEKLSDYHDVMDTLEKYSYDCVEIQNVRQETIEYNKTVYEDYKADVDTYNDRNQHWYEDYKTQYNNWKYAYDSWLLQRKKYINYVNEVNDIYRYNGQLYKDYKAEYDYFYNVTVPKLEAKYDIVEIIKPSFWRSWFKYPPSKPSTYSVEEPLSSLPPEPTPPTKLEYENADHYITEPYPEACTVTTESGTYTGEQWNTEIYRLE